LYYVCLFVCLSDSLSQKHAVEFHQVHCDCNHPLAALQYVMYFRFLVDVMFLQKELVSTFLCIRQWREDTIAAETTESIPTKYCWVNDKDQVYSSSDVYWTKSAINPVFQPNISLKL